MGQTINHSTPSHGSAQNLSQGKHSPGKSTERKTKHSDAATARSAGIAGHRPSAKTSSRISREERLRMIEEAAYYRAQQRGFEGGNEMQDWLDAEAEINLKYPD